MTLTLSAGQLQAVSGFLLELHQASATLPMDDFQPWVYTKIAVLIPHDSGTWTGGRGPVERPALHYSYRHNLPASMDDDWLAHREPTAGLTLHLLNSINQPSRHNRQDLIRYGGWEVFWRRYNVDNFLGVYVLEPRLALYHSLTLYRSDALGPFSATEELLFTALYPHLIAAYQFNRLRALEQPARPHALAHALADWGGAVHFMQSDFLSHVLREWPEWQGPDLPAPLAALCAQRHGEYKGEQAVFAVPCARELCRLHARPRHALDELSSRERQVLALLSEGLTHKEIARDLGVAPNTVRVLTSNLYRKVQVDNKGSAVALWKTLGVA